MTSTSMIPASALVALLVAAAVGLAATPPRRTRPVPATATRPADTAAARRARPVARQRALIAVAIGAGVVIDPLLACVVATSFAAAPALRRLAHRRRTAREIQRTLPDAVEMLILLVHAGLTPHQAVDTLADRAPAPTRHAFAAVRHRTNRGAPLADALDALGELLGPGAEPVADTLAIAERQGTPIAHALEQLARDVHERRQRLAEADARTLPVKMSFPLVTCTLPSFVLVTIVPAVMAAIRTLDTTGL